MPGSGSLDVMSPATETFLGDGFSFIGCCEMDVVEAFSKIKSNAIGADGVPLKFLRLILPSILPILTHVYNRCITESVFPCSWKSGIVMPIPKVTNPSSFNDWRPITVLPVLSKVLEHILASQILTHLDLSGSMAKFQSGFRTRHSTTSALTRIVHDLRQAVDRDGRAILVLLDLRRAFDNVPHVRLVDKLQRNFNFSRTACHLIASFLSDRSQAVKASGTYSRVLAVTAGVPQGAVLAPLLFSLFINDITDVINNISHHLYADDLQIYTGSTPEGISSTIARVNSHLSAINDWCNINGLMINPAKSQAIILGARPPTSDEVLNYPPIEINNSTIPFSQSGVKNLGLHIDSKLSWRLHISKVCAKVYFGLRTLHSVAPYLTVPTRITLVKTLLLPLIFYADAAFFPLQQCLISKLNRALNACIRFAFGLRRRTSLLYFRHRIIDAPLEILFRVRAVRMIYLISRGSFPAYLSELLRWSDSRRDRIILPHVRTQLGAASVLFRGASLWNTIPGWVKAAGTPRIFYESALEHLSSRDG